MDGLTTERLRLRRWTPRDRPVFHRLNSDEAVMCFFAVRMDRAEADATMDRWNADLDRTGMSFLALEGKTDGRVLGVVGLAPVLEDIYDFAPSVQIGWRLLPDAQGHGYATEAAEACLAHAFDTLLLPDIIAQCASENHASEAVMRRLGMGFRRTFPHPKVPADTHAHLVAHKLYGVTRRERSASRTG